jgi:hypothetical protein
MWTTHVLSSPNKNQVWLSLRDLDSENVFGISGEGEDGPVPIPALSSRHLRLTVRVKEVVKGWEFGFIIGNVNAEGNTLSCIAVGDGIGQLVEGGGVGGLRVLNAEAGGLDFGELVDGTWGRKVLILKNEGERGMDVKFGVGKVEGEEGVEVGFTLGEIAGEDEGDMGISSKAAGGDVKELDGLSRASTRDGGDRGRMGYGLRVGVGKSGNAGSPGSSIGRSSLLDAHLGRISPRLIPNGPSSFPTDLTNQLYSLDSNSSVGESSKSQKSGEGSVHPLLVSAGSISRVTSRTSSNHYHTSNDSDDEIEDQGEEDHSTPFFGINSASASHATSPIHRVQHSPLVDSSEGKPLPDQIEELTMRPGTEYRIYVHYRPSRDLANPPAIAGTFRSTRFTLNLTSTPSVQPSRSSQSTTRHPKPPLPTLSIQCIAKSATSVISLQSHMIDFGETTVGSSKSALLVIRNESDVRARVEIAAISKVLSATRGIVVIGPRQIVEERIEFFPRRINERYEKQVFVRNLGNRANGELRSDSLYMRGRWRKVYWGQGKVHGQ